MAGSDRYRTRQVVTILIRYIFELNCISTAPEDLQYKSKGTWYKFKIAEKRLLEPLFSSHGIFLYTLVQTVCTYMRHTLYTRKSRLMSHEPYTYIYESRTIYTTYVYKADVYKVCASCMYIQLHVSRELQRGEDS